MTKAQALKQFKREVAPGVAQNDKPACREAWNKWTDVLRKNGRITMHQYETWTGPKSCKVAQR